MKCIALRGLAFGRRTYIPGDVKGEWSALTKAVGGEVITLGGAGRGRINPLDAGARPRLDHTGRAISDQDWAQMVRRQRLSLLDALLSVLLSRPLAPLEHTALGAALDAVCNRTSSPLLGGVCNELLEPSIDFLPPGVGDTAELSGMGKEIGHSLARLIHGDLAGIFDDTTTSPFDTTAPMLSVDLSAFGQGSSLLPLIMTCTAAWVEASLRDPDAGKRYVIYDEAHRLLEQQALLGRMKDQWKLARAWGISNILVLHRLSDLDAIGDKDSKARNLAEGLLADTSTRIIYRQEADQIATTARLLGMTSLSAEIVPTLAKGSGLWMVGGRSFVVAHTRSEIECALTDTDTAMI